MKITIAIFLFVLSVFLIGQNLEKPFWGEHDWNGVRYGNIARNYLKYGVINLKFAQIETSGPLNNQNLIYYTHYPPMLPIVISFSYKIFGVSEWSTRAVAVISTSSIIVLIFLIGSKLFNLETGIIAALAGLLTPMVLYFGKNPSHEPLTLFFILLSFFGYMYGNDKKALLIFTIGLILAEMTAWAGYFLVPAITIVALLRKDFREAKRMLPFWFISIALFLLHLGYAYSVTGNIFGGGLFEALLNRSAAAKDIQPEGFNLLSYFNHLRLWSSTLFTISLVSVSSVWIIKFLFLKRDNLSWNIFILGLIGVIYLLVFSNAAFIHNYLMFYSLPFLSLSSGAVLISIKNLKITKNIYPLLIILFLVLVYIERRDYLFALNNSSADKFAVEVGKAINMQTNFYDKILISPFSFSYSADKFLRFYSDRKLIYSDSIKDDADVKVNVDQQNEKFEIIRLER